MKLEAYFETLASAAPAPGGGSAAALSGAAAAALVAMVARITLGAPKHAAVHATASDLIGTADGLRATLLADRELDEAAYTRVVEAMALPRASAEEKAERTARLQSALLDAARVPLETAGHARETLKLARRALDLKNDHLVSDIGCAAEFASAAVRACAYNVRINHAFLKDAAAIAAQKTTLAQIESEAEADLAHIRSALAS